MAINSNITQRRLVAEINEWSDNHQMIDRFGYGDFLELYSNSKNSYPYFTLNIKDVTSSQWYFNFTLEVCVIGWLYDNKEGQLDSESELIEILRDFQNTVKVSPRWQSFARLQGDMTMQKLLEKGGDKALAWCGRMTIQIKKTSGFCDLSAIMPEYDFESGLVINPSCDPASVLINSTTFDSIASGGSLDIPVKDTNGLQVGSKVGIEWIVPAGNVCVDATEIIKDSAGNTLYTDVIASGGTNTRTINDAANTLNGGAISGVIAEGTKAITLKDSLGATVTPTINTDTKTNLDLEIPVSISGIAYVRDQWTMNEGISNISGDLKDYINTTNVFTTYNGVGLCAVLDPNDITKLLTLNNFGNLNRTTNDKGGSNYVDVGGGLTSDGATANYSIDNFTGKGVYLNAVHAGTQNWNDSVITAKAFTLNAYDGSVYGSDNYGQFTMLTEKDVNHICTGDGLQHIFTGISNWLDSFHWIMFSATATSIFFWRENQKISSGTRFSGFAPTTVNSGIDLIVTRNHF